MRRWIGSMLAALLVAVPLVALYKSSDEKGKDRATQFKNIRADYEKAAPKFKGAYEAAQTDKERGAILEKLDGEFAPRIFELVEANPKDELSFKALSWTVQALPNMDGKVFELLADNWAQDAQIKDLCVLFMQRPTNERTAKLLRKILNENKDKDAQGFACYLLARRAAEKGKEDDKKAEEEAEKLYERVVKDFADVKVFGRGTLGDLAKAPLFEIRHLLIGKKVAQRREQGSPRQEGPAERLQRQSGGAGHLGDLVSSLPGHDSARTRHGQEAERQAVCAYQHQRGRREGDATGLS